MKIIHFSDTHLWITLENTSREFDFYSNFEIIIENILKEKPDYVIHSWDLFHTSKPSNKAISVVVSNFLKLSEAWIKVIMIAWNHDTPRLSTTTHSFEIFKELKWFYTFYEPKVDSIEFENINFVLLPHIHDENTFKEEFRKSVDLMKNEIFQKQEVQGRKKISKWAYQNVSEWEISFSDEEIIEISKISKKNIFVSHFWISYHEFEEYTDEISWVNISLEELEILKKFDYVALWHYHKNFCLPWTNICYSWSLEHTSFNQKNYKVWYNILKFEDGKLKKEVKELQTRKMIDFWDIDVENIEDTEKLIEFLEKKIDKNIIKDSIVKINFINMENKLLLDFRQELVYNFFAWAFYFEFRKFKKIEKNKEFDKNIINWENIINDNFKNFIEKYENLENKDKLTKELSELLKIIN